MATSFISQIPKASERTIRGGNQDQPWHQRLFTTENFLESALYGATGYKLNKQADDNTLGLIAGEVAGFIPFLRGAKFAFKGIGLARAALGNSRPVLKLLGKPAGNRIIQQAGQAPANSMFHAFKSYMGYEVAFQGSKLGVGMLDEENETGAELANKMLLYPALAGVGGAAGVAIGRAWKGWRGGAKDAIKDNQAVAKVRAEEAATQRTIQEQQIADELLENAGVKAPQRNLAEEGVISEVALQPNSSQVARESLGNMAKQGNLGDVSPQSYNQLVDEAIPTDPRSAIHQPASRSEALFGNKQVLTDKEESAKRVLDAVDESEGYKKLTEEKWYSMPFLRRNFFGSTSSWNAEVKAAAKRGEITAEDAYNLQVLRAQRLREVTIAGTKADDVERVAFEGLAPVEEDMLKTMIVTDATIDATRRWAAGQKAQALGRFSYKLPSGEIADKTLLNAIADGVKAGRLTRKEAGQLTAKIEEGNLGAGFWRGLSDKERKFLDDFLGDATEELQTAGIRLKDWENFKEISSTKYAHLLPRVDAYFDMVRREVLDPLRTNGMIDEATYNLLKDDNYLRRHFMRMADDSLSKEGDDLVEALTREVTGPGQAADPRTMSRLQGGSADILDFDVRMLTRYAIASTERAVNKNNIGREFFDVATRQGDASANFARIPKSGEKLPLGMEELKVINPSEDGTKAVVDTVWIDKRVAKELEDMSPGMQRSTRQMFAWITGSKPLRFFATGGNPAFSPVNMIRDMAQSFVVSDMRSANIFRASLQGVSDLRATMREAWSMSGPLHDAARKVGLQGPYYAHLGERGIQTFEELVQKGTPGKGQSGIISAMTKLSEFSEWWMRLANFHRALKNQATAAGTTVDDLLKNQVALRKAAFESNRIMDFQDAGRLTRDIDVAFAPYLSAQVQGTRSVLRAAQENPMMFAWKTAQLGSMAVAAISASMMVNRDGFKQVSEYDKANNYVFMTPFEKTSPTGEKTAYYFKFPKPQIPGFTLLFDTLPRFLIGGEVPDEDFFDEMGRAATSKMIPPSAQALLAYFGNKDLWTGRDIVSPFMDVSAQFESNERTSVAAKNLGEATGISPMRAEAAFGKLFTSGNPFMKAAGMGWKGLADLTTENEVEREWFWNDALDTFPLTSRFLNTTQPVSRDIYRTITKIRRTENDYRAQVNGQMQKIYDGIANGTQSWNDVLKFIRTQPATERPRLIQSFKFHKRKGRASSVNGRILSAMTGMPVEAKGEAAYAVYQQLPAEDKAEFLRDMRLYPGFGSGRMWAAFHKADASKSGRALNQ